VRDVVDARDLNADEDRARHGRFSFHDREGNTNRAGWELRTTRASRKAIAEQFSF
jgi:hypothetical protein